MNSELLSWIYVKTKNTMNLYRFMNKILCNLLHDEEISYIHIMSNFILKMKLCGIVIVTIIICCYKYF